MGLFDLPFDISLRDREDADAHRECRSCGENVEADVSECPACGGNIAAFDF